VVQRTAGGPRRAPARRSPTAGRLLTVGRRRAAATRGIASSICPAATRWAPSCAVR